MIPLDVLLFLVKLLLLGTDGGEGKLSPGIELDIFGQFANQLLLAYVNMLANVSKPAVN